MALPPLLKLLMPLVLPGLKRPLYMKFAWRITVVSLVIWNSGVVMPCEANAPGNL